MMHYRNPLNGWKYPLLLVSLLLTFSGISFGQSIDLDKKLGAENAVLVELYIGLYDDEEMTDYVRSIGNRLLAGLEENPFDFHFYIADDPLPNAFALPGGYVYVTRGILSLVTTEDELACVMGHEIIHVIERHSIKQMRKSILPRMLEIPGNIVGSVLNEDLGDLLNTPITTSNSLLLSSYSRRHETEADVDGIELASKAGYDPNAMSSILDRLSRAVEVLTNEKDQKSYFDDHPYTPDRVKKITKTAAKLSWETKSPVASDFPAPLDGLVFGYNPSKGVFKDQVFFHPDLNFTITFPRGWELSNQPATVGAIHENRQAGVFVGLEDPSKSPEEYARIFEKKLEDDHGQKPARSQPHSVNNHPGYLITMVDNTGDAPMYIHILWLKMSGKLFKLIGIAPRLYEKELRETAQSLRTLTSAERKSIEVRIVRIIQARDDETLEDLSKRAGNVIKTNIISIMNDVEENTALSSGRALKIVTKEKYVGQ